MYAKQDQNRNILKIIENNNQNVQKNDNNHSLPPNNNNILMSPEDNVLIYIDYDQDINVRVDINLLSHFNILNEILDTNVQHLNDIYIHLKKISKRVKYSSNIIEKKYLKENLINILYLLADLSLPLFDMSDIIEDYFYQKYKHSPELAKNLFIQQISAIHRPTDILKNKTYKLLEML